jgi:hypothetical protein
MRISEYPRPEDEDIPSTWTLCGSKHISLYAPERCAGSIVLPEGLYEELVEYAIDQYINEQNQLEEIEEWHEKRRQAFRR